MSKLLNKRYWATLFLLFTLFVSLIGYTVAQENVILGEAVMTSEPSTGSTEEIPVSTIDAIAGIDFDHFAYLPIVAKSFLLPEEQAVLDLINAHRVQAGCAPLIPHRQLTAAARGHSTDMALNDYFSHTSLDGRSPWDRMAEAGYTSFSSAGENIAAGYSSPASVVNGWMNSSGHRANILNCNFTETGIGYYYLQNDTGNVNYRRYWTQDFARP